MFFAMAAHLPSCAFVASVRSGWGQRGQALEARDNRSVAARCGGHRLRSAGHLNLRRWTWASRTSGRRERTGGSMALGPEASITDEIATPTADAADERDAGEKAIAGRSLRQIAWRRLKKDKVAIAGGCVVIFLVVIAFLAPILTRLWGHPIDE